MASTKSRGEIRQILLKNLQITVQDLVSSVPVLKRSNLVSIQEDSYQLDRLCTVLEDIFRFGLKDTSSFFASQVSDFWEFVSNVKFEHPSAQSAVESVSELELSDAGKGRAFLMIAISQANLENYVRLLCADMTFVGRHYEEFSIFLNPAELHQMLALIALLTVVEFNLCLKDVDFEFLAAREGKRVLIQHVVHTVVDAQKTKKDRLLEEELERTKRSLENSQQELSQAIKERNKALKQRQLALKKMVSSNNNSTHVADKDNNENDANDSSSVESLLKAEKEKLLRTQVELDKQLSEVTMLKESLEQQERDFISTKIENVSGQADVVLAARRGDPLLEERMLEEKHRVCMIMQEENEKREKELQVQQAALETLEERCKEKEAVLQQREERLEADHKTLQSEQKHVEKEKKSVLQEKKRVEDEQQQLQNKSTSLDERKETLEILEQSLVHWEAKLKALEQSVKQRESQLEEDRESTKGEDNEEGQKEGSGGEENERNDAREREELKASKEALLLKEIEGEKLKCEVNRLKEEKEAITIRYKTEQSELERACEQLKSKLQSLQESLEQETEKYLHMDKLSQSLQEQVIKLTQDEVQLRQSLQKETEEKALKEAEIQEYSTQIKNKEKQMRELAESHEEAMAQLKAAHETSLSQTKEAQEALLEQAREEHEAALLKAKEAHSNSLTEARESQEAALAELVKTHQTELIQVKEAHDTSLTQLKETHERGLTEERESWTAKVEEIKSDTETEKEGLQKKIEELKELRKKDAIPRALFTELEQSLDKAAIDIAESHKEIANKNKQIQEFEQQFVSLKRVIQTLKEELIAEKRQHAIDVKAQKEELQNLEEVKEQLKTERSVLEEMHMQMIKTVENTKLEMDEKPTWVPNDMVVACTRCETAFGLLKRRHHCRACGNIFCSTCSGYKAILPDIHPTKEFRVCISCAEDRGIASA